MGHYRSECPTWEEKDANYAAYDDSEEVLLMAIKSSPSNSSKTEVWFLDSGCSNHMVGIKEWLYDLNDSYRDYVKLGDDSRMQVEGIGNLKLYIQGRRHCRGQGWPQSPPHFQFFFTL
jgi:hypothetical protein